MQLDQRAQAAVQFRQSVGQPGVDRRHDGAAGDKAQAVALALDDAPAATPEARIDADDSHHAAHVSVLRRFPGGYQAECEQTGNNPRFLLAAPIDKTAKFALEGPSILPRQGAASVES